MKRRKRKRKHHEEKLPFLLRGFPSIPESLLRNKSFKLIGWKKLQSTRVDVFVIAFRDSSFSGLCVRQNFITRRLLRNDYELFLITFFCANVRASFCPSK